MMVVGEERLNPAHISKMGKAALAYAQKLGWSVLPLHTVKNGRCTCGKLDCPSPGKHPHTARGVHDATTDPVQIKEWWKQWPDANIGIRCGRESGFFVIDIDGEEGEDSLKELEKQYDELPETIEQITGSGGRHILFKYPAGIEIRPRARIMPGIDVRGNDSYIVVAPSIHASGREYCWEIEHRPSKTPLAEAPDWLIGLITKPAQREDTPASSGSKDWAAVLEDLKEGKRNDTLYRYACHLLAHGLSYTEVFYLLFSVNRTLCMPPLPDDEVVNILKSAQRWRNAKSEGGS